MVRPWLQLRHTKNEECSHRGHPQVGIVYPEKPSNMGSHRCLLCAGLFLLLHLKNASHYLACYPSHIFVPKNLFHQVYQNTDTPTN